MENWDQEVPSIQKRRGKLWLWSVGVPQKRIFIRKMPSKILSLLHQPLSDECQYSENVIVIFFTRKFPYFSSLEMQRFINRRIFVNIYYTLSYCFFS
mmetsp:Transcript_24646/g.32164  ORF Transcript_24646/g.32164 Transcript_24646/m.32164 type:complete len:97 (+) Transcript_24646:1384-1674(+)